MAWSPIHRNLIVFASFCAQLILEGVVLALDVLPPYVLKYFRSTNAEVTLFGAVVHGFSQVLGKCGRWIEMQEREMFGNRTFCRSLVQSHRQSHRRPDTGRSMRYRSRSRFCFGVFGNSRMAVGVGVRSCW